jgi:CheY-like chemotaxis protein
MSSGQKKQIGSILLKQRAVSKKQLDDALKQGKRGDPPLVSRLTEQGIIDETEALKALSEQSGCPGIDLNQVVIRIEDLALVPRDTASRHCVLPLLVKGNRIFLAMADPADKRVVNEIEMVTGKRAFPYIALKGTVRRVIAEAYELREQGQSHYIGAKCSDETLRKQGVQRQAPRKKPPAPRQEVALDESPSASFEKRLRPSNPKMKAIIDNPVVVDDHMAAHTADVAFDEPTFTDFEERKPAKPRAKPAPSRARRANQRTLMVVDDDPATRTLVGSLFRERGYIVVEAASGDTALQMVHDAPPHVIVLEATLPNVHGFEVARELKGHERYRGIRIIMMSGLYKGWGFAQDVKTNYGVDGFLEKPLQLDELVLEVERAANERNTPPATSAEAAPFLNAGIAAYKAGRLNEAVEQLRQGIEIDPLAYKVHFHLGLLYGKLGQLYDAIQELETALSIRSDFFPALKNLAVLYQNAGFRNKAIEMWERCLASAADDETRESIKRLLVAVL